jgi:hypothetical protein
LVSQLTLPQSSIFYQQQHPENNITGRYIATEPNVKPARAIGLFLKEGT